MIGVRRFGSRRAPPRRLPSRPISASVAARSSSLFAADANLANTACLARGLLAVGRLFARTRGRIRARRLGGFSLRRSAPPRSSSSARVHREGLSLSLLDVRACCALRCSSDAVALLLTACELLGDVDADAARRRPWRRRRRAASRRTVSLLRGSSALVGELEGGGGGPLRGARGVHRALTRGFQAAGARRRDGRLGTPASAVFDLATAALALAASRASAAAAAVVGDFRLHRGAAARAIASASASAISAAAAASTTSPRRGVSFGPRPPRRFRRFGPRRGPTPPSRPARAARSTASRRSPSSPRPARWPRRARASASATRIRGQLARAPLPPRPGARIRLDDGDEAPVPRLGGGQSRGSLLRLLRRPRLRL